MKSRPWNISWDRENPVTPQTALERLSLTGTLIPEPGTGLLMAVGLLGMALRRRAAR